MLSEPNDPECLCHLYVLDTQKLMESRLITKGVTILHVIEVVTKHSHRSRQFTTSASQLKKPLVKTNVVLIPVNGSICTSAHVDTYKVRDRPCILWLRQGQQHIQKSSRIQSQCQCKRSMQNLEVADVQSIGSIKSAAQTVSSFQKASIWKSPLLVPAQR
jgi:hypothetical protein